MNIKLLIFSLSTLLKYFILILFFSLLINYIIEPNNSGFVLEDSYLNSIVDELRVLDPTLFSSLRFFRDKESYTINKSKIYICMIDKEGKYYPKNFLKYVILHEVSHVMCTDIGHTPTFYKIFDELIEKAHNMKVYDKTIPLLTLYCGYN